MQPKLRNLRQRCETFFETRLKPCEESCESRETLPSSAGNR
nr:MAG TPA: hypothetical protein [Caudoviricetes sp.]